MAKSEKILIVIPSWLKDAVKKSADSKGVTMSEFTRDALKDAVGRTVSAHQSITPQQLFGYGNENDEVGNIGVLSRKTQPLR